MVNVTAFVYDKIIFIPVYWVLFLKHIENEWPSSICTLIERNTKLLYKYLLLLKSQIVNQIRLRYTHAKNEKTTWNTCRWHSSLCICCTNEHFKKIPPIHICSIIKYSDTLLQHHFMYKQVIWKSEIQQRGVHLVGMGIDFEFSDQFKCNNIYEKYSATEYTFIP